MAFGQMRRSQKQNYGGEHFGWIQTSTCDHV
jgi:hypothetical protein